jgi:hypothetical protein
MKYDYHDATLKSLKMDWIASVVDLEFLLCNDKRSLVRVTVSNCVNLRCPHEAPWGDSSSVNTIEVTEVPDDVIRLEIEMQSGDVIVVVGKTIKEREERVCAV